MPVSSRTALPAGTRTLFSLVLPVIGLLLLPVMAGRPAEGDSQQNATALQLAGAGLVAWFVGLAWYGLRGLGLRGHRPLYAGIGFAALGWLAFLLARFVTVEVSEFNRAETGRTFIYLLLFEAFCSQLWTFGLFFRSAAEWRGPLTAAVAGGVLFGLVAFLFFQEAFVSSLFSLLYFVAWGIFYGLVRLRTGSILGMVIVQAMHSLTAWRLMRPPESLAPAELTNLYLVAIAVYAILTWRLWPKKEEDYRV